MMSTKHIFQCVVALICVYTLISAYSQFREQKRVPLYKQRHFHEPLTHFVSREIDRGTRTFKLESDDGLSSHTMEQSKDTVLHSYDIVIVSMSEHWYEVYTLPRQIRCNANRNVSILIRKASGDEDRISQADILIFAGKTLGYHDWTQLQRLRHGRQLWVHTTEESPFTSLKVCPPKDMNIVFNMSFTYHPEADISVPYGQFLPNKQKRLGYVKSNFDKKTKLIVWVSSHCSTPMWRRSEFAYDLSKYLPLDTYGSCGTLNCPKQQKCEAIFQRYKFYLAMENSCCGGYITEKFWKALVHLEAIPVVVGAPKRDYDRLAPNNSFIHADDFGSMKELAEYILKVSKSKELFNSYFEWKFLGKATINPINSILAFTEKGVCRLIEHLESLDKDSHIVSSFSPYGPNWFDGCNECGEKGWLRNYSNFNYDLYIKKKMWNV